MKLFQSAQRYLAMMGIRLNQNLANVNFFMAEILIATQFCFGCVFVIFKANTFREYAYIHFSTQIMAIACFTIFAAKRKHFFNIIDIAEELTEKSEQIMNAHSSIA